MPYSIHFQIAGLLLLILVAVDFYSKKHIRTRAMNYFVALLFLQFFSIISDIVKTIAITKRAEYAAWVPDTVWKVYSLSVMLFATFFAMYCWSMCEPYMKGFFSKLRKFLIGVMWTAGAACAGILLFCKPEYISSPYAEMATGFGVYMNAYYSLSSMLIATVFVILFGKKDRLRQQSCSYLVLLLGILVTIVEIYFQILIIGFALCFVVLIIYFTLENPDISLIKELDKEKRRADEANRAKSDFLASMSHDIRSPLGVVMGMNEMILRESQEPQILEYAENIKASSNSLMHLINDILDFSKIEAGKMPVVQENYDTRAFLKSLITEFDFRAKEKNLILNLQIAENLPSALRGDDSRIRQILANLLSNAIKYTEKGRVTLDIGWTEKNGNALLHVAVSDTGIGIKEEDMGKIFDKFERGSVVVSKNIEGSGLGLSIAMKLLNLMGSEMHISSCYGEGSTFNFDLEQKIVDASPVGDINSIRKPQTSDPAKVLDFTAPEAKILAVDDNDMNLFVLKVMLKRTEIQLETVHSGKECLQKVSEQNYDIIFLDHMMPEMDGFETFYNLKQIPSFAEQRTPVVVLTANAIIGARENYFRAGFADYLTKPIDTKKMENILLKYIPSLYIKWNKEND